MKKYVFFFCRDFENAKNIPPLFFGKMVRRGGYIWWYPLIREMLEKKETVTDTPPYIFKKWTEGGSVHKVFKLRKHSAFSTAEVFLFWVHKRVQQPSFRGSQEIFFVCCFSLYTLQQLVSFL